VPLRWRHQEFVPLLQTVGSAEVLRLQVSWDGLWEDGDTEMQRHLVIKELSPTISGI
jgi:hypothetical protein